MSIDKNKIDKSEIVGANAGEPTKEIEEIKTFRELKRNYYIIPKNKYDNEIVKILDDLEIKKDYDINLVRRGKKNKKLTKEQIEEIRNSKLSNAKLSKIYNVGATTIFRIKNNQY